MAAGRDGSDWLLEAGRERARLRDGRGLRYLRALLAAPGRDIAALDLVAGGAGLRASDTGPVLDAVARDAYRARLAALDAQLDTADRIGDARKAEAARVERDALVDQLRRDSGLGGRPRSMDVEAERARVNVTRTLRAAVERIAVDAPRAAAHLDSCLHTGRLCRYQPGPAARPVGTSENRSRPYGLFATDLRLLDHHSPKEDNHAQPRHFNHIRGTGRRQSRRGRPAASLVLLHGLTYDRRLWGPVLTRTADRRSRPAGAQPRPAGPRRICPARLYRLDQLARSSVKPSRTPGCGRRCWSATRRRRLATIYASLYPTSGMVNVDQPLLTTAFAQLLHAHEATLRGPGYAALWDMMVASMHTELLAPQAQLLLRTICDPRQDLLVGYWDEVLTTLSDELTDRIVAGLAAVRAAGVPYHNVFGQTQRPSTRAGWPSCFPTR